MRSVSTPRRSTLCGCNVNNFSSGTNTANNTAIPMTALPRTASANAIAATNVMPTTSLARFDPARFDPAWFEPVRGSVSITAVNRLLRQGCSTAV